MSMILKSYDEGIVLPPEGSDEWMALLPGWSGWMGSPCSGRDYAQPPDYSFWSQTVSYIPQDEATITIVWDGDKVYRTTTGTHDKKQFIWGHQYVYSGGYYYFAGNYCGRDTDDTEAIYYYKLGRATSLEPQI